MKRIDEAQPRNVNRGFVDAELLRDAHVASGVYAIRLAEHGASTYDPDRIRSTVDAGLGLWLHSDEAHIRSVSLALLDPVLFSLPVGRLLVATGQIVANDVVALELTRYKVGIELNEAGWQLAMLFAAEAPLEVPELLRFTDDAAALAYDKARALVGWEREAWLWLQLWRVRQRWDELDCPHFDLEDILNDFDDNTERAEGNEKFVRVRGAIESQRHTFRALNES